MCFVDILRLIGGLRGAASEGGEDDFFGSEGGRGEEEGLVQNQEASLKLIDQCEMSGASVEKVLVARRMSSQVGYVDDGL